jgi:hypothetical protein
MKLYLSASSISDFISCPKKVLYRITKPFPEVPTKEMILGIVAHKAIEDGWKSKETAYDIIEREVRDRKLTRTDITNLQFCIDMFFLNFRGLLENDDRIEHSWKIPLYDDVFIVGRMDRISKGNVFDWKTGNPPKKLDSSVQCMIYDYAYTKLFMKPPSSICLASLSDGSLTPYRRDELCVKELFEKIIPRMIKTVRESSYERLGIFNHGCLRCPYKQGCLGGKQNVVDNSVDSE